MNVHAPQSYRTQAELKWLCAIVNHLRSPKNGGAVIGLVQDALAAGYLLSREETRVHREIFYDAIESMKHPWSREIPEPVGRDEDGRPVWTGRQLLSMAMPVELNLERGKVKIYEGVVVSGTLDKKLLGVGSGSLVHLVVQQLGEDRAADFLDNLHDVCIGYLRHRGFTFGLRDISVPEKQQQAFNEIIKEAERSVDSYLERITDPRTGKRKGDPATIESTINTKLNQVLSRAGKEVLPKLPRSNLTIMAIESESKGKSSNIIQFCAYVGQQNVYGERIPCGMIGRTLPHFKRGDIGLRSRGFVENPYVKGLTPQEVFMHAAGGREGLVDTAIKTAKTGYALRQITNALSDITVDEFFCARTAQGNIVQFAYGGDNIDPCKLLLVKMDYASLSAEAFATRYYFGEYMDSAQPLISVQQEWDRLVKDRRKIQRMAQLPDAFLDHFDDDRVTLSVDIDRLILDAKVKFKCGDHAESVAHAQAQRMHPNVVIERVNELVFEVQSVWAFDPLLVSERRHVTKMLRIVIRSRLASKRVIQEFMLSQRALDWLCKRIVEDYKISIVHPGEAVGILSAQSNGEPQQQMTLNTFHFAGISAQNVTLGVPRIKEVIHCTREPKLVNTFIYMDKPFRLADEQEQLNVFRDAWVKRGEVVELLVRDAIAEYSIDWDPDVGSSTRGVADEDIEAVHALVYSEYSTSASLYSKHVLRLRFDQTKLAQHGLTFGAVTSVLREALGDGITTKCMASDSDAPEPVFRMRARYTTPPESGNDEETWKTMEHSVIHRFYQQQVENIRLGGLEGVRNVFIREDKREGVLMLDTDCRDLQQAMNVNDTVFERCECNHPLEVFRTQGVEAARQSIIIEIRKVYRYYGINVDARHLTLIADAMTYAGGLMSLDRHGINHAEYNTLKKAAFEEIADVLTKAAVSAKCDPLCDNTSRIMIGQEVRVGTGTFDLLLDRDKHERLSKKHHQPRRQHIRMQRRKRAIADRMAVFDQMFGGSGDADATDRSAPLSYRNQHQQHKRPISLEESFGSGSFFDGLGADASQPFSFAANEEEWGAPYYSPASPIYSPASPVYSPASPVYRPNDGFYSPTSATYSPTAAVEAPTDAPYSPTSPRYSPTSPRYSPTSTNRRYAAEEYDPSAPGPRLKFEVVPVPYDPEMPMVDDDEPDYSGLWETNLNENDDDDDVQF